MGVNLNRIASNFDEMTKEVSKLRKGNKELRRRLNEFEKDAKKREEQEEKDELAFYIKSQREARKLGFDKFARLIETHGPTLQNHERGKGDLNHMQLIAGRISKLGRQ